MYMYICMYACMHACMYVYVCIYIYIRRWKFRNHIRIQYLWYLCYSSMVNLKDPLLFSVCVCVVCFCVCVLLRM